MTFKRITVFGGAAKSIDTQYNAAAFKLGEIIGQNNLTQFNKCNKIVPLLRYIPILLMRIDMDNT